MSARKVCKFVELWPDELVAMTGNRLRYPQIKSVMRHILSFYDEISCSVTESAQSSPVHPTVQQTIKRTDMKAVTVSTKKKCRRGDKSQDQTTSKKTTSGVVHVAKDSSNNVVTPARNSMPRNKLTSIVKSSQEKTSQPQAMKKGFAQQLS